MDEANMRDRAEKLAFKLVQGAPVGASDGDTFYMRQPDPKRLADALVTFAHTIAEEATERAARIVEEQRPTNPASDWTEFARDRHAILTSAAAAIRSTTPESK